MDGTGARLVTSSSRLRLTGVDDGDGLRPLMSARGAPGSSCKLTGAVRVNHPGHP
jgi:hypothetical protein